MGLCTSKAKARTCPPPALTQRPSISRRKTTVRPQASYVQLQPAVSNPLFQHRLSKLKQESGISDGTASGEERLGLAL